MKPADSSENITWLGRLLTFFFFHLYHTFAYFYDLVAFIVSLGHWKKWVTAAVPYLEGPRILELGFGPGHLQVALGHAGNLFVIGLDESRQMAEIAARRLKQNKFGQSNRLIRGRAENLPFLSSAFDTVVATFPTPYIIRTESIGQISRVLKPGGRLVVLLAARHAKLTFLVKISEWLFRITGEAAPEPESFAQIAHQYEEFGFSTTIHWESTPQAKLLLLIAYKPQS